MLVTGRYFKGIPHPDLLGDRGPAFSFWQPQAAALCCGGPACELRLSGGPDGAFSVRSMDEHAVSLRSPSLAVRELRILQQRLNSIEIGQ